ncbi:unnamed protein product [Didymodactylos carnosus]|uniref:Uncharacterized protein n=1 Tax=Didymodactylos carnosus TaxID=1234261 RepID=A0A815GTM4_9BILA|nr:unnamed protein product [Didymodactylos carnosus]CAF1342618.1 unnamed protein product [Didymodactylos carnosus]CAF4123803.1 unnamed protein product [Didymodactylos carnosus]CAF4204844.1 unnamed protein product [Didymodactylos carnosus]
MSNPSGCLLCLIAYTDFPPAKSEFHKPTPTDCLDCQISLGFPVALSITLEFILTGTLALNPHISYDITIAQNTQNKSVYDTTGVLSINFDIYVQGTLGIIVKGVRIGPSLDSPSITLLHLTKPVFSNIFCKYISFNEKMSKDRACNTTS